jgi:hypothetical protein
MKKLLFALIVASIFASCGGGEKKAALQQADSLRTELADKDQLIEEVFASLGEITANLNRIKERENMVSAAVDNAEIGREPVAGIAEDIRAIDELLRSNRESIAKLEKNTAALRNANVKIGSLESLVAETRAQIEAKNAEIEGLMRQLQEKNAHIEELSDLIAELSAVRNELEAVSKEQQKQLNTAYYIIGERKELVSKGLIDRSGLFNKNFKVNQDNIEESVVRINIETFDEVLIGRKKIDVVTSHPTDSYRLVQEEDGTYVSLVILDKAKFWELSRLLVISYR